MVGRVFGLDTTMSTLSMPLGMLIFAPLADVIPISLVFIIGGSLGLSKEVLSRADYKLSFSKMTFPHQLMRVILLEQIYRSYRIIQGEPYHK